MAGRVQRTPPKTPKTQVNTLTQAQTQSEPDINSASMMSEYVNTNRSKRPRQDNSPQSAQVLTPQLLQEKLDCWKTDQDSNFSKLLTEQTTLIAKLVSDIGEIKSQNSLIQASNAEIRKSNEEIMQSMSFMNNKFEDMKKEVEDLRKERREQQLYIENLEKKIVDLQLKSRSSGIEIRNIPQEITENNIILTKTVCKIGEAVGVPITRADLRDLYRLPGKSSNANTPRSIIAEFTTVQTKQSLVSAVRNFNKDKAKDDKINTSLIGISGKRLPVYITEQLPPSSKKLLYVSREFAKKNGYQFCWISNGNIFLRKQEGDKQILINSVKCLEDLESNNK